MQTTEINTIEAEYDGDEIYLTAGNTYFMVDGDKLTTLLDDLYENVQTFGYLTFAGETYRLTIAAIEALQYSLYTAIEQAEMDGDDWAQVLADQEWDYQNA